MGEAIAARPGTGNVALLNNQPGILYQHVYGRIPHQQALLEKVEKKGAHHFAELARRAMDALGLDYQVVFPTPMLTLGMHPQDDIEAALGARLQQVAGRAHPAARTTASRACSTCRSTRPRPASRRSRSTPTSTASSASRSVSTRNKPVHHNSYMKLYAMMEETGKPFAFHSGFNWNDPSFLQLNRFISMHALSFVHYSLIHMTNWIINGLPERFPKLKVLWVESGLAWIPFLMQRLDHEYQMRVVRGADAEEAAERVHARHVLHQPADGEDQPEAAAGDDGSLQGRDAAALRVGLAALGFRSRRARSPRCRSSASRPSATSSASTPRASSISR